MADVRHADDTPRDGVAIAHRRLNRIDEIVPPGTDIGTLDQSYLPPGRLNPSLRRLPACEPTAA